MNAVFPSEAKSFRSESSSLVSEDYKDLSLQRMSGDAYQGLMFANASEDMRNTKILVVAGWWFYTVFRVVKFFGFSTLSAV